MKTWCDWCGRLVPVAPGFLHTSGFRSAPVAHVVCAPSGTDVRPCGGHPVHVLTEQHAILDDDMYWEGL